MKKVILNYKKCFNSGELGLLLDGVNEYTVDAATDGVLIAHDVIEHNGVGTIGGICDELEALGVIWWIRGSLNDIRRDNIGSMWTPYEHVAADIARMAERFENCDRVLEWPIPFARASDYDDDFRRIVDIARKQLYKESGISLAYDKALKTYFSSCIHFMRNGYRKAKRRYQKLNQHRVNALFWNVAEAVDSVLN